MAHTICSTARRYKSLVLHVQLYQLTETVGKIEGKGRERDNLAQSVTRLSLLHDRYHIPKGYMQVPFTQNPVFGLLDIRAKQGSGRYR